MLAAWWNWISRWWSPFCLSYRGTAGSELFATVGETQELTLLIAHYCLNIISRLKLRMGKVLFFLCAPDVWDAAAAGVNCDPRLLRRY